MSSSFLKPVGHPGHRVRHQAAGQAVELSELAVLARELGDQRRRASCANRMPGGTTWRSLPFGPWTSTASAAIFTVTPFGIGIGFFPIRDMLILLIGSSLYHTLQSTSPPTPAFRAARPVMTPREVVRMFVPSPPSTVRHVLDAEIDAAARTADPLEPGDHLLAARPVLQEHANDLARLLALFRRRLLDDPEALDVALVLENPRDLRLQLAGGHVDTRVLGRHPVADARQHVGNRIGHISLLCSAPDVQLPTPGRSGVRPSLARWEFSPTRSSSSRR